jgi:hypothetical protein
MHLMYTVKQPELTTKYITIKHDEWEKNTLCITTITNDVCVPLDLPLNDQLQAGEVSTARAVLDAMLWH